MERTNNCTPFSHYSWIVATKFDVATKAEIKNLCEQIPCQRKHHIVEPHAFPHEFLLL